MDVKPVSVENIGRVVEELWLPLAEEMELVSVYNRLDRDIDLIETARRYKEGEIADGNLQMFVAEDESEFLGFVSVKIEDSTPIFERGKEAHVEELYVKEYYRRQGVASNLLDRAEDYSRKEGADMIQLSVDTGNRSAAQFYSTHGFEEIRKTMVKDIE